MLFVEEGGEKGRDLDSFVSSSTIETSARRAYLLLSEAFEDGDLIAILELWTT
jgi:hypothetical protein